MKFISSVFLTFLLLGSNSEAQTLDFPPDCSGGNAEFKRVIRQEMLYPEDDLKMNVGGKVLLSFLVYKNGEIDSLKILEGVSKDIDREAFRLIRLLRWTPGIIEGQPISTYVVKRIHFKPHMYKKWLSERDYDVNGEWPTTVFGMEDANPDPKFVGGGTLFNFISRNLEYPSQAQSAGVEGIVKVRLVVEKSGRITSVGVEEGIGGGCDEEALRVIRMTKWKAGMVDGKLARIEYFVPIEFRINEINAARSSFEKY